MRLERRIREIERAMLPRAPQPFTPDQRRRMIEIVDRMRLNPDRYRDVPNECRRRLGIPLLNSCGEGAVK